MNELLLRQINSVEQMLEECEYVQAVDSLHKLAQEYPTEGIIAFYLGRMCLIGKDDQIALQYFETAVRMDYKNTDVYLSMALLQKNLSTINEAERSFFKALEMAGTKEKKWACSSCLAVFYIENEMYLKADKIAKKMIKEYPDNYQGYHLHIIIETLRGHFEEVFAYIDMLPKNFKSHPQHLIDLIEIYKKSEKDSELVELFDNDIRFNEVIPQIVLKEKIVLMPNDEFDDTKEKLIRDLANYYQDSDAIISIMILEFGRKNFKKSSQIANIVLENEKRNLGLKFYLAMYFQIYNLYYLADKKPSDKLCRWIEKAGNWCIKFTDDLNISAIGDTVRNSIKDLFEEINNAKGAE